MPSLYMNFCHLFQDKWSFAQACENPRYNGYAEAVRAIREAAGAETKMRNTHLFGRLGRLIQTARRRHRDRVAFASMDERDLRDAGLNRTALAFELNKPFWRD